MSKSNMPAESVSNLPLSPSMRALLSLLVLAIDRRIALVQGATGAPSSITAASGSSASPASSPDEFATCCECGGLGFVPVDEGEAANAEDGQGDDNDDNGDDQIPPLSPPDNAPADPYVNVDHALANALQQGANISVPVPTASLSPTSSNLVPADVKAAVLAAMANTVATAPAVAVAAGGSGAGSSTQVPVGPSQPAPAVPSQPTPAAPSQPAPVVPAADDMPPLPTSIPRESVIPGGFFSMSTLPAPAPDDAVYTDGAAGPFYTVTRGVRVGVMSGWDTVSPYVVSVPGAVYRRHPTLQAAFIAYFTAYYRHSVKYI